MTLPEAMASQDKNSSESPPRYCAEENGLKLILWIVQALFENRNTLPQSTYEKAMGTARKILGTTEKHKWVRYVTTNSHSEHNGRAKDETTNGTCRDHLGELPAIWSSYVDTFNVAVPALEVQSFVTDDPAVANANGSSSTLMALNHHTLMKDLERLDDIVKIGRNIFASTFKTQDLAGESGIDQHILKLVDLCVRVTARGYDGEAGSRSETQWANVVGLCKYPYGQDNIDREHTQCKISL